MNKLMLRLKQIRSQILTVFLIGIMLLTSTACSSNPSARAPQTPEAQTYQAGQEGRKDLKAMQPQAAQPITGQMGTITGGQLLAANAQQATEEAKEDAQEAGEKASASAKRGGQSAIDNIRSKLDLDQITDTMKGNTDNAIKGTQRAVDNTADKVSGRS